MVQIKLIHMEVINDIADSRKADKSAYLPAGNLCRC